MDIQGKNILITGADGFIGSHLTEILVEKGANVKALALYNSFNNWGWLENINCLNEIEVICGDVRDPHFMKKITKNTDIIFHLAALIAIPFSYTAPDMYIDTNIKGTLNVCQAALENNVSKLIHTSTSEVYGTAKYIPIDENHPIQPQSPYSASKIGADSIVESFYRSFDLPACIARPFNAYGPRQSARAVIPSIIIQAMAGKKEIKLGDTRPTRDFNYVKDTCSGLVKLAESDKTAGETINIGSNYEISIGDLFKLIKSIMNSDVEIIKDEQRIRPEKSEVERLWCDNTKIKQFTDFNPEHILEKGLKETIDWFSMPENMKKYKENIYNV
ncbi:MAG TPA: NAD-dependent 4,6-dehydratase LegB [Candidatus Gastranaerophilales bacterium]|nr:NAD-dependent 4,6-dehydratase LegB [Candidatus Gastranaerophilales bacterium]